MTQTRFRETQPGDTGRETLQLGAAHQPHLSEVPQLPLGLVRRQPIPARSWLAMGSTSRRSFCPNNSALASRGLPSLIAIGHLCHLNVSGEA